jgi:sulfonate transport system permease protein
VTRGLRAWAVPALVLLLWWAATSHQWVSSLVLVPLGQLLSAAGDPEVRASLLAGVGATFTRLALGGLIGGSAGLLLGTAMGLSRAFDRIMGPSFHAFRQVAIFAWIPLLTAWFGNGHLCKIVFVAVAAAKPVVMGSYEGVRSVDRQYLELGRVLCFSRWRMLRQIVLPAATPALFTALQLSLIFAWFAAIGAEYVIGAMAGGIGSVVMAAQEHLRTDIVLLGVALIAAIGISLNTLLRRLPRVLFRWKEAAS